MKFIFTHLIKNFPFLYKQWQSFIKSLDFKYYEKNCKNYKIIPFGCYCLPRIITTTNRLKPTKDFGEESFPFDLCFSEFDSNIKLLADHFNDFYNSIEFNNEKKCWVNNKYGMIFNHENMTIEEFKNRYNKRINNLYSALKNVDKYVYFVIASYKQITNEQIGHFINVINTYRNAETYSIIIINQTNKKTFYEYNNVYSIDLLKDKSFNKINRNGNWADELKKMTSLNARIFNYKVNSKLSKYIKTKNH